MERLCVILKANEVWVKGKCYIQELAFVGLEHSDQPKTISYVKNPSFDPFLKGQMNTLHSTEIKHHLNAIYAKYKSKGEGLVGVIKSCGLQNILNNVQIPFIDLFDVLDIDVLMRGLKLSDSKMNCKASDNHLCAGANVMEYKNWFCENLLKKKK